MLLLLAAGFVYGAFFADTDESNNPMEQPVPEAGDCIAADRYFPITVSCDDLDATVQVVQVIDGDNASQCALVPEATEVLQHESVLKVGGADGIDVGDAEIRTLCVRELTGN
ncbi:hypothetical protein C6376_32135 [Streptomyces sp. P3]|uniref:hypothetical protein n=1 Tax=Streptomyces sp. P3 TaxID=2135430 RepID=UPI000D1AC1DA|nr:hypothetical protein [Streptomyces sp. P3]AVV45320.1 hypothetical protein C6376_32135 [Streptomyces sp. P3]